MGRQNMKLIIECGDPEVIKYDAILKYKTLRDGIEVPISCQLSSYQGSIDLFDNPVDAKGYINTFKLKLYLYYDNQCYWFKFSSVFLEIPEVFTINVTQGIEHPVVTFCGRIPKDRTIISRVCCFCFQSW
jgi:hypothetical protein